MGAKKYRTVVAAILTGAILFSPLLCGMTCLEEQGIEAKSGVEFVLPAKELVAGFAESAVVGCVIPHLVSKIDFSEWADQVDVATWVWVGVEVLRMFSEVWREGVLRA